jgi:hypothetical protein
LGLISVAGALAGAALNTPLAVRSAVTASPDDMGRAGRSLSLSREELTRTAVSWPGVFYGFPAPAALAVSTAGSGFADAAWVGSFGVL